MEQAKPLADQIASKCRHYNGLYFNKRCEAGIAYDQVRGAQLDFLPCFKENNRADRCAFVSFLTPEEVAQKEQEMNEEVAAFLTEMAQGKTCVICHAPIENKYQVGRCVYAEPCAHRQYQGTLPKKNVEDEI